MLWGSALRGLGTTRPFAIEHCRNTVGLGTHVAMGTAGILWGWALKGYSAVGRCRNTPRMLLVTQGLLCCCWALQGYSAVAVGHWMDTHWLGTVGILGGWALQDTWWLGTAGILGGCGPK